MRYVIVDLEATCWENGNIPEKMEIIEIGAVLLASGSGPISSEFATFVQPVATRQLSPFCTQLTSIRQEDVDSAEPFWGAFPRFLAWIGEEPFCLCSWGAYDLNQFRTDCARHKFPFPASFENHINLKKAYSQLYDLRPHGMKGALTREGIPLTGTHHRGIDDARNIAQLALKILPRLEEGNA